MLGHVELLTYVVIGVLVVQVVLTFLADWLRHPSVAVPLALIQTLTISIFLSILVASGNLLTLVLIAIATGCLARSLYMLTVIGRHEEWLQQEMEDSRDLWRRADESADMFVEMMSKI